MTSRSTIWTIWAVATKYVVQLYDDVDGSPAAQTVSSPWTAPRTRSSCPRTTPARYGLSCNGVEGRPHRSVAQTTAIAVNNLAVRAWAASNGIQVRPRGRIPTGVLKRYRAAGH